MAEVQIPTFTIFHEVAAGAADKIREARLAVETLWLLDLARESGELERRLRETTFTANTAPSPVFTADVPD